MRAKLRLYSALVESRGMYEGEFSKNSDHEMIIARFYNAREHCQMYVDQQYKEPDYPHISIGGMDCLVEHELEARKLIDYVAENDIGNGFVEPVNCYHGTILFNRMINLPGWNHHREDELIEILAKSDAKINNPQINRISNRFGNDSTFDDRIKEEIAKVDTTEIWRNNLSYS